MDANVKQKVRELADALVATEAYTKLQEARGQIAQHTAAQVMLRDLLGKQQRLQEKIWRGEEPSEAEIADYEQTAQVVSINPYIRRLLEAEMQFRELFVAVQRELAQAVGLDAPESEAPSGTHIDQEKEQARSRLWIPGQD